MTDRQAAWGAGAVTLAVSVAGALVATKIGLSLPWLLGPLFASALLGMSGWRPFGCAPGISGRLRLFFIPVIALAISSTLSPEILASARDWWLSLAAIVPLVLLLHQANYQLFRRVGGYDPVTAYFAASPGGVIEATLMGDRYGGKVGLIALQHSMRVSLTIVAIPFILVSVIDAVPQPELRFDVQAAARAIPPRDAVLLILAGVIGATVARRLRLPAGVMIGPFMLGSVLYATGVTQAGWPLLL